MRAGRRAAGGAGEVRTVRETGAIAGRAGGGCAGGCSRATRRQRAGREEEEGEKRRRVLELGRQSRGCCLSRGAAAVAGEGPGSGACGGRGQQRRGSGPGCGPSGGAR